MASVICTLLTILTVGITSVTADSYTVKVGNVIHHTDERFLSFTIDSSMIQTNWVHENISSTKLLNVTKPLAPAYLRIGGTTEDNIIFQENPNDSIDVPSGEDFQKINEYAINSGISLVYGLNAKVREGSDWNPLHSAFNSTNAKKLIQFADNHEYDILWQLGNEPDLYSGSYKTTATQISKDFVYIKDVLDSFPRYSSKLIGPDTFDMRGSFIKEFVQNKEGMSAVSAVTVHHYYFNGETAEVENFVDVATINGLNDALTDILNVIQDVDTEMPLWLSETSSAYRGGAKDISDRFVAGFLWIDKLGMSALKGVSVVVRQDIYGYNYGLVDENMNPNPDWWLSVLFKQLVGTEVLEVPTPTGDIRLYAHCVSSRAGQPKGAVVLYGMNVATEEVKLDVSSISDKSTNVLAYILTGETGLESKTVLLNENRLELRQDGSLPEFSPVEIDSSSITVPPESMVFYIFPDVNHSEC